MAPALVTSGRSFFARLSTLVVALGLAACSGRPPVTLKASLPHEDVVLENGLRVIVQREPAWRSAVVDVRYRVGSANDPAERTGLAHFVEHLMFRGTRDLPGKAFDEEIANLAGTFNAITSRDATEYFEVVPTTDVPGALFVEAQRMAFPLHDLSEAAFATERNVVDAERRLRHLGPEKHVRDTLADALFPSGHPYHGGSIGSKADLERATISDARAFVARHYGPENATLVVVGNVDVEATLLRIAHDFGSIPRRAAPPPLRYVPVALAADVTREIPSPFSKGLVVVAWHALPEGGRESTVLRFAATYLEAVLTRAIVEEAHMARKVDVDFDGGELGSVVSVVVKDIELGELGRVHAAIDDTMKVLSSERELWPIGGLRSQAMLDVFHTINTPLERARYMQDSLALYGNADTAQRDLLALQAVSRSDVAEAIEKLRAQKRVVVNVVPKGDRP